MKGKAPNRLLKYLGAPLCLAVCALCCAQALRGWLGENGRGALLFAAGLKAEAAEGGDPAPSPSPTPGRTAEPSAPWDLLWEADGVVPFHENELPPLSATPDPNRASAPVEETALGGGSQIDSFFVRDTTGSGTDLLAELAAEPAVKPKCDGSIEVLLYHTHTSEAYSENALDFYYTDMETRTSDPDQSVVAVGEEMKKALEARGIGVVHDTTVNDSIYNGSYSRSWEVLQKNLAEHPTIQVTVDLHRDSMTTESGTKYKPTAVINDRKAAQAMLLAGCDFDGSWGDFPNWEQNLRFILRVQQKASQLYPELVRPLSFSNCKYNMNATPGSMLIEVGTEVNSVWEARYTGRLMGEILAETLLDLKE